MKRRSGRYLNAREWAERLVLSDNPDIVDFARDFLEALDSFDGETLGEIKVAITGYTENCPDEVKTYVEKIEWLGDGSNMLGTIEELIEKSCPEYANMDTDDAVADMIRRLHPEDVKFLGTPKLEYDL